jgi:hypothetical protein
VATDKQLVLFEADESAAMRKISSTFVDNMRLPTHRWFRYSAGFSAQWAQSVIDEHHAKGATRVLDPFAGSATTLLAAEDVGVESYGIESHPFVSRVASAKLARRSDPNAFRNFARDVLKRATAVLPAIEDYPRLVRKCYHDKALCKLDQLRRAFVANQDESPAAALAWLTLVGILRKTSHVGTANWQYVLPNKVKKNVAEPFAAYEELAETIYRDMKRAQVVSGPAAKFVQSDARTCEGVPVAFANLVITSPPYPNNFDYADATRLEMCFLGEINGWGDLQQSVRQHLVRSCSQHCPERAVDLDTVLCLPELAPIQGDIANVCQELADIRMTRGGKKTYHLMVACYFLDLANVWRALRRVCDSPCKVCFVIGDSAPYGIYVPVIEWLGQLAVAAGFHDFTFEKTRDRNTKWKNRKHRVPLCEGRLWVDG